MGTWNELRLFGLVWHFVSIVWCFYLRSKLRVNTVYFIAPRRCVRFGTLNKEEEISPIWNTSPSLSYCSWWSDIPSGHRNFFQTHYQIFCWKSDHLSHNRCGAGLPFVRPPWHHIYIIQRYTLYYKMPLSAHGSCSRLCLNLWRQGRQLNNHELDRRQGRLVNFVMHDALRAAYKSRTGMRLAKLYIKPVIAGAATSKDRCLPAIPRAAGMSVWT